MNSVSRIALAMALTIGGAATIATAPADAKKKPAPAAASGPAARQYNFSKEERAALLPLQTAITAKDWAAAAAAMPAARAASVGTDAKYAVARYMLEISAGTQNIAGQAEAIDALIASGGVSAADLPTLYRNQGALAVGANNNQKAETAYNNAIAANANDVVSIVELAKIKANMRKPAEAVQLLQRAIAIKIAAGQTVDESWYKYALKTAFDNRLVGPSMELSRGLVAAYPTSENWRDAVLIYRDLNSLDTSTSLDLLRFLRASKGLAGERDWYDLAESSSAAGYFGEAKAVLDEGTTLRMIDPKKAAFADLIRRNSSRLAGDKASLATEEANAMGAATGSLALKIADAWAGYGEYAKAIPLYRAALTKGSVDANVVNTHLGAALALSGDRAGAETSFRAVTGARQTLVNFWLAWLGRRP